MRAPRGPGPAGGRELLATCSTGTVSPAGARRRRVGPHGRRRLAGTPVVGVAVAADRAGRPTPDGYRLATRAYRLAARLGLPVLSLVDTPGAEPGAAAEADGVATAMAEAMDALLELPGPTLAVVHGEGGSGGALAAAAADRVLVTPDSYFAAIGPEGAAAALRRRREECANRMRITRPTCSRWASPTRSPSRPTPPPTCRLSACRARAAARRSERWGSQVPRGL